ncbi:hypothetical protein [Roseovarius pacificus]|nr:hypothetical protein [Roseovarius pacificus]
MPMSPKDRINAVVALCLLCAGAASIFVHVPEMPVGVVLIVMAVLNRQRLNRPARIIGVIVMVLFFGGWLTGWLASSDAMPRVIFLGALLIALGILSRAASRAEDVRRAASIVANRPRGARYLFVMFGTHVFAIFLNFGAAALMATLLAQSRDTLVRQNAVEDLTLAMLRGFAAMPMWSPLALSTIITLSILPEVGYFQVLPYGIAAAVLYVGAGYLLSKGPSHDAGLTRALPSWPEQLVLGRVVLRVVLLVAVAFGLHHLAALSMPASVLVAVLCFSLAWWGVQILAGAAPGLHRELAATAGNSVNEIVIVSGAGFLGAVIAETISAFGGAIAAPPDILLPVIVALVPVGMVGAGLWAVNPIVSASILLGVLHPLVPEPALIWLALAAILGWGITAASSPFTANVLITSRIMGLDGGHLVRRGNLKLTVLALLVVGLFCATAVFISLQR